VNHCSDHHLIHQPSSPAYDFKAFYHALKQRGFVIYPGKVTGVDTFRIGNIGDIHPQDIERLLVAVGEAKNWG
jgi:2-aminoethylphosphonate-pyruvate transaminase